MKPQDIVFFLILFIVLYLRNPRVSAGIGLVCLLMAMPLFHFWVFFTAQRFTYYAAAFFLVSIAQHLGRIRNAQLQNS